MGKVSKEIKLIKIKDGNNKMFSSMWEKVMKRKCISSTIWCQRGVCINVVTVGEGTKRMWLLR